MITDPQNIFEQVQNEIAARIKARPLFTGLKMADGSDFDVLTEDEGDPEMLYTAQIASAGLSIIVQSPTAKFITPGSGVLEANPFVIGISISEVMLFNRTAQGTNVRLMRATFEVLKAVNKFAPPSIQTELNATRLLKDRDTLPKDAGGNGELVTSRILIFEATEVAIPIS